MSSALIIAIVAVTVGGSFGLYKAAEKNMRHVHGLEIPSVDISQLKDSTYKGSYSYIGMSHRVAVTVEEQKIKEILVIKNGKRKWAKMAEGVIPRVIEAQNTDVDAVSGATTSSKALLMANL
ncbi:MAG: FMN-binding protein [Chitinivibrionales bacterium]